MDESTRFDHNTCLTYRIIQSEKLHIDSRHTIEFGGESMFIRNVKGFRAILAFGLCLILLTGLLAGCQGNGNDGNKNAEPASNQETGFKAGTLSLIHI